MVGIEQNCACFFRVFSISAACLQSSFQGFEELIPSAPRPVFEIIENMKFYKGGGCDVCAKSGYKGRVGIYEALVINKEVEQIILSGEISEYKMQEVAVKNGMVTMVQDGLLKAADGLTSIEEVFRVAE